MYSKLRQRAALQPALPLVLDPQQCRRVQGALDGAGSQSRPSCHVPQRRQRMQGVSSAQEGAGGQNEEDDGGATEHMLLMALESLYKDATEQDVRLGLLRTTLQILQRHGKPHHEKM